MRTTISRLALAGSLLACGPALAQPAAVPSALPAAAESPAAAPVRSQRPNVLAWMMDDVGFAQLSCFGGLVATPNIDRVARMGLRYANYHTAPICSASRASFLTGRMPHSVHVGGHAASARPHPGYDARIPASAGTIAAHLRQAGYATFALGKWDHLPTEEATLAGPFTRWPSGQGFDRFYGFLAADADNFAPILLSDQTPVAKPGGDDYHLSADLADQAIAMIRMRGSLDPAPPFFLYWATGAAHAPHHAPGEWLERYRGKFDMGWDKARETILGAQKAQGLVPRSARLGPRPEGLPAWNSLSPDQKRLYARQMEAFAAALSHADEQFGRILDALEASGELANTMVIVTSDNGASAEGAYHGLMNEAQLVTGEEATVEDNLRFLDDWGGPRTYPHYSFGWAVAGNTPFRFYKQTTHEGGSRVPLVVSWPKGIAARGELRNHFTHVSDIAPTILEAAGIPPAPFLNNAKQDPMEGTSFAYSFSDPGAADRKLAQYFEMHGNRALWRQGWVITTSARTRTWDIARDHDAGAPWELYDLSRDPGQTTDLATRHPARVTEMAQLFEEQAKAYNVYPLGGIAEGSATAMRKAREDFEKRGGKWRYAGPVGNIPGMIAPPVAFRSFTMTARLDLAEGGVTGPLFGYGGQLGGMGLYLRQGKPVFLVNSLLGDASEVASDEALPTGSHAIELDVQQMSADARKSGGVRVTIRSGDRLLAQGKIDRPIPRSFGISETFGVGIDNGSPVLAEAKADTPIAGRLADVVFDFTARADGTR